MKKYLPLALLVTFSVALAQSVPVPVVPATYADFATYLIGVAAAILVHPLTAICKRFGRTSGVSTVVVSAVLSLLVSGGYTVYDTIHTHSGPSLWSTLISALTAFLIANGAYLAQVSAALKGASVALPTVQATAVPQVLHPVGTPGTEPLHDQTGKVIGAVAPLTSVQPVNSAPSKGGLE